MSEPRYLEGDEYALTGTELDIVKRKECASDAGDSRDARHDHGGGLEKWKREHDHRPMGQLGGWSRVGGR